MWVGGIPASVAKRTVAEKAEEEGGVVDGMVGGFVRRWFVEKGEEVEGRCHMTSLV